jgi:hypothetical protein
MTKNLGTGHTTGGGVDGDRQQYGWGEQTVHTGRENLEQFRTTESYAWASGYNSYYLSPSIHYTLERLRF